MSAHDASYITFAQIDDLLELQRDPASPEELAEVRRVASVQDTYETSRQRRDRAGRIGGYVACLLMIAVGVAVVLMGGGMR